MSLGKKSRELGPQREAQCTTQPVSSLVLFDKDVKFSSERRSAESHSGVGNLLADATFVVLSRVLGSASSLGSPLVCETLLLCWVVSRSGRGVLGRSWTELWSKRVAFAPLGRDSSERRLYRNLDALIRIVDANSSEMRLCRARS